MNFLLINLLVMLAMGSILKKKLKLGIILLTIASVVFRFELAILLLLTIIVQSNGKRSLLKNLWLLTKAGVITAGMTFSHYYMLLNNLLAIIIPIDSFFWRRFLWPELSVFYFNGVLGKSSEWGTSPWHWYWTNGMMMGAIPATSLLALLGVLSSRETFRLCLPSILFILLMSFLPHKELRFIFHTLPPLIVAAANFLTKLYNSKRTSIRRLSKILLVGLIFIQVLITLLKVGISKWNYQSGYALLATHEMILKPANTNIHIDSYCAMNGISRFLELNQGWR